MIKLFILLLFCFGITIAMLVAEIYELKDDISKKDLLIMALKGNYIMKIIDDSVLDLANGIIKQALVDLKEDLKHIEKGHFQHFRSSKQLCLSEHDALNIIDFLESKEYNITNLDGWTLIKMMCKEMVQDGIQKEQKHKSIRKDAR